MPEYHHECVRVQPGPDLLPREQLGLRALLNGHIRAGNEIRLSYPQISEGNLGRDTCHSDQCYHKAVEQGLIKVRQPYVAGVRVKSSFTDFH